MLILNFADDKETCEIIFATNIKKKINAPELQNTSQGTKHKGMHCIENYFPSDRNSHNQQCNNCKMYFMHGNNYSVHTQQCTIKLCVICNKTFTTQSNFKKHLRTCPPKRHMCPNCPKSYARKTDRDRHVRTHMPLQKTFVCHLCACEFLTGRQLQLHIEQIHSSLNYADTN
jgi:hypothetical protein